MMTRAWFAIGALTAAAMGTSSFGCDSDDDEGTGGGVTTTGTTTGTATGTATGGTGGNGGQGAGGGQGGAGGGLSVSEFCDQSCPGVVACGQGGGGGGQPWPPTLQDCLDGCSQSVADCTPAELQVLLGCMTPHIDPNCDMDAFTTCAGAAMGCMLGPADAGVN